MSDFNDYPSVYDSSLEGGVDTKGAIKQVWNRDALSNAIKMWITSFSGEFIREPWKGGTLTKRLQKLMVEVDADSFKMEIANAFSREFEPYLIIDYLNLTPVYDKKYWHIEGQFTSVDLKMSITLDEKIMNLV